MEYTKIIKALKEKGIEEGLTIQDYRIIRGYLNDIELKKYKDCKLELEVLIIVLEKSGLLKKINPINIEYISKNCDLLPIVYNNRIDDRIVLYSTMSYRFLCHFHQDNTPSLGVTDSKNLYYCFGCCTSGNVFDYVINYEGVSFIDSFYLISSIYGINIPNNKFNSESDIVKNYRQTIISSSYKQLLDKCYKRLISRREEQIFNHSIGDFQTVNNFFEQKFDNIERIKNNIGDQNFNFSTKIERVFLEKDKEINDFLPLSDVDNYVIENKKQKELIKKNNDIYYDLPFN